jgi:hypothetical protein
MPYDTPLDPKQIPVFENWVKRQSALQGRDISRDVGDYDLSGLFKKVNGKDLPVGHGTDEFKKPNHPTFSQESIYHNANQIGGRWDNVGGKDVFYASPLNVKNMGVEGLRNYFKQREPGVQLVLPPNTSLLDLLGIKK